jgi:hypothetical protein
VLLLQLVAKALVSGFLSVVVALAASSPGGGAGLVAQSAMDARNACVSLAAGAYREVQTGDPVTLSVYSPFQMNVSMSGSSALCSSGGQGYAASLPSVSLPFELSFTGAVNITVSDEDGRLLWW